MVSSYIDQGLAARGVRRPRLSRFGHLVIGTGLMVAAALATLGLPGIAQAQAQFPNKPVKAIVPYAAGGTVYVLARLFVDKLSTIWNQPLVVEEKPGAEGSIGASFVARSPADGYTLLFSSNSTNGLFELTHPKDTTYHTMADFDMIALVATSPLIMVMRPGLEDVKSVKDVIRYAQQQPPRLKIASVGEGSIADVAAKVFLGAANIQAITVPYNGQAPAIQAVLSGEVDTFFSGPNIVSTRPLAVTAAKRVPQLPDVPTFLEQGLPGVEINVWFGICGPKGIPEKILSKLQDDILSVVNTPEMQNRLIALKFDPTSGSGEVLAGMIRDDMAKTRKVLEEEAAAHH